MAEHRIVEEINDEFELPQHTIQHIQSFLTGKAAAQTALLSKSWHNAWLTRPHIDFDCPNNDGLLELANKTIQRYELSNLKIESFRLRLRSFDDFDFANMLIVKALKLDCAHLSFEIEQGRGKFVIPREVFECENLLGLSLGGCRIGIGMDHNVRCSRLESLSLNLDGIDKLGVVFKIISSCPLIENLSLSCSNGKHGYTSVGRCPINLLKLRNLKRLVLSGVKLGTLFFRGMSSRFPSLKDITLQDFYVGGRTFDVEMDRNVRCSRLQSLSLDSVEIKSLDMISEIILSCPLIENMSFSGTRYKRYCESVISGPIRLPKLHNIKCLVLRRMQFDTLFLCDLSSKFPLLKDLTLDEFRHSDQEEIKVSSHSLEHLKLATDYWTSNMMFELDVPSIRKFTFEGPFIPSVSFKPTSREWESHVSIEYRDTYPLDTSWFVALNELLTTLIPSKIYLSIGGRSRTCFCKARDILGLPQPEVENLTMDIRYVPTLYCFDLFDGIFRSCRPKFITQYLLPDWHLLGKRNSDYLCETLAHGVNGEFSSPRDFVYGLNGLKEVNVQVFDEFVAAWKDFPCNSLLEASECLEEKKKNPIPVTMETVAYYIYVILYVASPFAGLCLF